jgi:ATPase subunit of ABC transporter with duplicated ATPase domains
LFLPQELGRSDGARVKAEILAEEEALKGQILARLSRLGSDPTAVMQSPCPSPGETRKLLLARGILCQPSLIILDEPTNHLDLGSIRLLKEALQEFPGALLVVSHDRAFLRGLVREEWRIEPRAKDNSRLEVGLVEALT